MEYIVRSTYTRTDSRLRRAADIAVILLFSALLVFLFFRFVLVPFEVKDNGLNGLKKGELVLVDRLSKYVRAYELGDMLHASSGEGTDLLGRAAAFGGDTYTVVNGKAYLNDALVDESEYGGKWEGYAGFTVTVPEGSVLVLPDVRTGVSDIEACVIPLSDIRGEVRFLITPISKFTAFD